MGAGIMEEICSYWDTRVEGYSQVNEKEWRGKQNSAWYEKLIEKFPNKEAGKLKVLDIGCGPGFFTVLLSKAGFNVTSVDYTPSMLVKAKENLIKMAPDKVGNVKFMRMDAQNLEFNDQEFDVVLSRNLTWNLPDPKRAYSEWHRVLKKGGVMLNFDANWYSYLYDDKKREEYDRDRKNVENGDFDDHYTCTDIDRMENIALQVPMSKAMRPKWDMDYLKTMDWESLSAYNNVGDSLWSDEEKINYASTPMFMIYGVR